MQNPNAFVFILFGSTGDLSMRKILPGLYQAHRDGVLHPNGRFIATARSAENLNNYLEWMDEKVRPKISNETFNSDEWERFKKRFAYVKLDVGNTNDFSKLAQEMGNGSEVKVFYLATGPSFFIPICQSLSKLNLQKNARIVLEKPLGSDLQSSKEINDAVGSIFDESQIYRIDHYLGKEPVQNLLALRFGNVLFEALWRREWVESIQITISEQLGVEERKDFYDKTGALRDMVQNHLLQLLAIVAMEPPISMDSDRIRDEKLRVLRALKPLPADKISKFVVSGQYIAGYMDGKKVQAYKDEVGDNTKNQAHVNTPNKTETFVALQVEIENWRWAGVPFYLRTGKRLNQRKAEIVVNFKAVPHSPLGDDALRPGANRLVIQLQPQESIRLSCLAKQPGVGMHLQDVHLDLNIEKILKNKQMEAYERLLLDVIAGRQALFVRRDEQEAAWRWVEPILKEWQQPRYVPKTYASGSWGPHAASTMLARNHTCWLEEEN